MRGLPQTAQHGVAAERAAGEFPREQRVSGGQPVQLRSAGHTVAAARKGAGHHARALRPAQPPECEAYGLPVRRRGGDDVGPAARLHEPHREPRTAEHQVTEEPYRCGRGPFHVVEQDDHRAFSRQVGQQRRGVREDRLRRGVARTAQRGKRRSQRGVAGCQFAAAPRGEPAREVVVRGQDRTARAVHRLRGAGVQDSRPPLTEAPRRLVEQSAQADARLARQRHHTRSRAARVPGDQGQLSLPADEVTPTRRG